MKGFSFCWQTPSTRCNSVGLLDLIMYVRCPWPLVCNVVGSVSATVLGYLKDLQKKNFFRSCFYTSKEGIQTTPTTGNRLACTHINVPFPNNPSPTLFKRHFPLIISFTWILRGTRRLFFDYLLSSVIWLAALINTLVFFDLHWLPVHCIYRIFLENVQPLWGLNKTCFDRPAIIVSCY